MDKSATAGIRTLVGMTTSVTLNQLSYLNPTTNMCIMNVSNLALLRSRYFLNRFRVSLEAFSDLTVLEDLHVKAYNFTPGASKAERIKRHALNYSLSHL